MHDAVSNGFVNVELYCFIERCRSVCGIHYEDFQCHCLASWHLPDDGDAKKIAKVLSKSRENASSEKFKSDASETWLIFPLVLNFAETLVSKGLKIIKKGSGFFAGLWALA